MNKFFKRLALLLAVLMIVSMMPVQLFAADNGTVTSECQHIWSDSTTSWIAKCTKCDAVKDVPNIQPIEPVEGIPEGYTLWTPGTWSNYGNKNENHYRIDEAKKTFTLISYKKNEAGSKVYFTAKVTIDGEEYQTVIDTTGDNDFNDNGNVKLFYYFEDGVMVTAIKDAETAPSQTWVSIATKDAAKVSLKGDKLAYFVENEGFYTSLDNVSADRVIVYECNTKVQNLTLCGAKYGIGAFCDVVIDPNGGSFNGKAEAYTAVSSMNSAKTVSGEPAREGYKFAGWSIAFAPVSNVVTFTANWSGSETVKTDVSVSGNEATATVTGSEIAAGEDVSIDAKSTEADVTSTVVKASAETVEAIKAADKDVKIETNIGTLVIGKKAWATMVENAASAAIDISIVKNGNVYTVEAKAADKNVFAASADNGVVEISVNYARKDSSANVVVYYVNGDVKENMNATYDSANGILTWTTSHFSDFEVAEEKASSSFVAKIGDVEYETLAEAIAAANDGDTVTLISADSTSLQAVLDGLYGPINGLTLELCAGEYDLLTIGRVVAETKDNLSYICNHTDGKHYSFEDVSKYKEHLATDSEYHWTSTYARTMSNVTLVANGDVTIKGLSITSGHLYTLENPFREGYTGYYLNQNLTNFAFKGIKFVGNVDINTSSADTVISNFTFEDCSFTTNGTESDKKQAIRYYNENNNGNVSDLKVINCEFNNCYQGVYTMKIKNVSVTGSSFNKTGHNAIAVQGEGCDHGNVVISGNTFTDIGDRIIRFNKVGSGTDITITGNTATNSGKKLNDGTREIVAAEQLADDVHIDMTTTANSWGENAVLGAGFETASSSFVAKIGDVEYATLAEAIAAAKGGDTVKLLADVEYNGNLEKANVTIEGAVDSNGKPLYELKGLKSIKADSITLKNVYLNLTGTLEIGGTNTTLKNCIIRAKDLTYNEAWDNYAFDEGTYNEDCYCFMTKITGNEVTIENCTFDGTAKVTSDSDKSYFADLCLAKVDGNNVTMTGCTFNEGTYACANSAPSGTWTLEKCKFSRIYHDPIEVVDSANDPTIKVIDCDLVGCSDFNDPQATVSFENCRFGKTEGHNAAYYGLYSYANISLKDCTFTSDYIRDEKDRFFNGIYFGEDIVVEINNCTLDGSKDEVVGLLRKEPANETAIAAIDATKDENGKYTGGTFVGAESAIKGRLSEGYIPTKNADGTYGVKQGSYVAQIGDVKYETLADAIAAANDGDTVKLLADVTVDAQITVNAKITLDLNGKTVTSTWAMASGAGGEARYALLLKADVTVQNGTFAAGKARAIGAYGALNLDNVKVSTQLTDGNACVALCANEKIYTISETSINGAYALAIFANNATVNVSDSTLTGNGNVLYHNGSNYGLKLNVQNTIIESTGSCGVYISGSTATTSTAGYQKAEFINCTITGLTAIEVKYTDLTLENCTVKATDTETSYVQSNNGPAARGFAVVSTDNAVNQTTPKPAGSITIKGNGKFTGPVGLGSLASVKETYKDFEDKTIAISGGTFSNEVPADYCTEGYIPTKNADGTYGVKQGSYIAQIGDVKYETLADAIAAANDGETVKLLADVEQNSELSISKSITLDLAGHKIYNTVDIWNAKSDPVIVSLIDIENGASVTITGNGTITAKENDCYTINVTDGKLTIENGTFVGNISVVQVVKGMLTVNGGNFSLLQKMTDGKGENRYLINCIDAAFNDGTAKVAIYGGTFVGFDPNVSPEAKVDGKVPSFAAPGVGITKDASGNFTAKTGMTAQILDASGNSVKAYTTLAEAIASATDGDTVKLLSDITIEGPKGLEVKVATGVTFDLNGHSIDGSAVSSTSTQPAALKLVVGYEKTTWLGEFTLKDTGANGAGIKGQLPLMITASGYADAVKITIEENVKLVVLDGGKNAVELSNKAYLPYTETTAGYYKNGGFLVTAEDGEQRIYEQLSWAQTANKSVTLMNDYTVNNTLNIWKSWGSITLDLNGHTYATTASSGNMFELHDDGASITFKNGTLKSATKSVVGSVANNTKLVLDGVTVEAGGDYGIAANGSNTENTMELRNSTIKAPNGFGIYFPSSGTLTINGGNIEAKTGVQVCAGTLKITGNPTITATGSAEAIASSGSIMDGAAVSIINRAGYGNIVAVTIDSGKFTSANGVDALQAYAVNNTDKSAFDNSSKTISISGGTFSSAVPEEYCADGFIPTQNADGTYSVKEGKYVAQIGDVKYETLEEAFAAATSGDTITLLEDCKSDRINLEDKSVTVVLNGKTLTSTAAYGVMFCAKNGNKITIDGTVEGSKLVGTLMITAGTDGRIEINGGTYENSLYCPIYVNGAVSSENSTVTVKNAIIKATNSNSDQDSGCAVYLAGYSTSVFENCTITAPVTGIEIRAGKLTLSNCNVTGGNGEVKTDANGNGTTVTNAALAISQHNTKKQIEVTIDGGTFTGKAAVYQTDVQRTGSADVKIAVKSGTFDGTISGETDGTIAISGGKFKVKVDDKYFDSNYACSTDKTGEYYTVVGHPIISAGLTIGESLTLRITVDEIYKNGKLKYTYIGAKDGKVHSGIVYRAEKDKKGNWVFRISDINAQRADVIYTVQYVDESEKEVGSAKEVSILKYCEGLVEEYKNADEVAKNSVNTLVCKLLNYSAAAMDYRQETDENDRYNNMTWGERATALRKRTVELCGTVINYDFEVSHEIRDFGDDENAVGVNGKKKVGIEFSDKIRLFFNINYNENYTYTYNGLKCIPEEVSGASTTHRIYVTVAPFAYDSEHCIEISDADGFVYEIAYSLDNALQSLAEKSSGTAAGNLAKATYEYCRALTDYAKYFK